MTVKELADQKAIDMAFRACRLLKRFANGDETTDHGNPTAKQEDYRLAVECAEAALDLGNPNERKFAQRKKAEAKLMGARR